MRLALPLLVGADLPEHGRQILAAVSEHGLSGEGGLPHPVRHQIQEPHLSEDLDDVLHNILVHPPDPAVLSNLGQGRLIGSNRKTTTVLPLFPDFSHAKQQVHRIVLDERIRFIRMTRIDQCIAVVKRLFEHTKPSEVLGIALHADGIGYGFLIPLDLDGKQESKIELLLLQAANLPGSTPNRLPLRLTAGSILPSDGLRERVTAANAMEKTEGVADVAFSARIRAHDYGERTDAKRLMFKVLEIRERDRSNHGFASGPRGRLSDRSLTEGTGMIPFRWLTTQEAKLAAAMPSEPGTRVEHHAARFVEGFAPPERHADAALPAVEPGPGQPDREPVVMVRRVEKYPPLDVGEAAGEKCPGRGGKLRELSPRTPRSRRRSPGWQGP